MLSVPVLRTLIPPPLFVARLPVIVEPWARVTVPPTARPPPFKAVLDAIVAPLRVRVPPARTPPPVAVATLPAMVVATVVLLKVVLSRVRVPVLSMPPPEAAVLPETVTP